jgi:hypothetical protein
MLASGRKSEGREGAYKPENSAAFVERGYCGKVTYSLKERLNIFCNLAY